MKFIDLIRYERLVVSRILQACPYTCLVCINENQCLSCDFGFGVTSSWTWSYCGMGQYKNGEVCDCMTFLLLEI